MDILGSFALILALLCAAYAVGAGIVAIVTRKPLLIKSARHAGLAVFPLVTLAVASLEVLFFSTRLLRSDLFELPVTADLHRAV